MKDKQSDKKETLRENQQKKKKKKKRIRERERERMRKRDVMRHEEGINRSEKKKMDGRQEQVFLHYT